LNRISVGKDFSPDPAGRYRTDGDGSGEAFREDCLKPLLKSEGKISIIIDDGGVEGYGSSFLVEGFAGLVKYGYIKSEDLLNRIEILYDDEDYEFYKKKIIEYIKQAKYASKKYDENLNKG